MFMFFVSAMEIDERTPRRKGVKTQPAQPEFKGTAQLGDVSRNRKCLDVQRQGERVSHVWHTDRDSLSKEAKDLRVAEEWKERWRKKEPKKNERQLFILYVAYTSPVGKEQPCAIGFYNQIWTAIIYFFPFHKKCFLSHRKVFLSSLKPSEILQKKTWSICASIILDPFISLKNVASSFLLIVGLLLSFSCINLTAPPLSGPTSCVLQGTAEDDRTRERFIFGKQIKTKRVTWYSGRSLLTWEGEAVPATSTPRLCRPAQNLDGRRSVNTRLHAKRHLPFTWVTFWLTSPTFIFFLIAFDHRWLFHSRL